MTSEVDFLKTNEFIQRRKLRLQQVREQSKDIAKKIRQRAKVETLRQVKDVDAQKKKHYLECQKQFVNKLQEIYAQGLEDVGSAHKNASKQLQQDFEKKVDKSKLRGKEAVTEVRRKKQEILDKKKELLDRKLQAREAANEISREKSNVVLKTLIAGKESNFAAENKELECNNIQGNVVEPVEKVDMGTQLNLNEPSNGYQTDIPELLIPENDTIREPVDVPERLERTKRPNLFALSDEMPSSLRGGPVNTPEFQPMKSTVNIVSEHIQNRHLRLRETEAKLSKRQDLELQNIKQTIMRTRASKPKGNSSDNVCQVLDNQLISVPSWRAEQNCKLCDKTCVKPVFPPINSRRFKSIINSSINKNTTSARSPKTYFPKHKLQQSALATNNSNSRSFNRPVSGINKDYASTNSVDTAQKSSVTMYNHLTKDSRTLLANDDNLVIREQHFDDDAFTKARKEDTSGNDKQKDFRNKLAERRNKVAVTKDNVDKEYRDTLAFLNSLPKDMTDKPIRNAFMDEARQQQLKDKREQKLRDEYRNVEKQCRGHHKCRHVKYSQNQSKPSINKNEDSNDDSQYSWIPGPEIQTKQSMDDVTNKHCNTVKFSNKNDYHEYRSSRKHSPPTKDIPHKSKVSSKYVETAIFKEVGDETTDCSSIASDTTTTENITLRKRNNKDILEELDPKLTDSDRIIIYKILNSKSDKKKKGQKTKLVDKVCVQETVECDNAVNEISKQKAKETNMKNKTSFDQLTEGIYKTVNNNGDNLTTLQVCDPSSTDKDLKQADGVRQCSCVKLHCQDVHYRNVTTETATTERPAHKCQCALNTSHAEGQTIHYPSAATSTTSLKIGETVAPKNGCIKVIDDVCQENGKFYVGTTGYLKDEAYEVVIQLRKKENANVFNGAQGEKTKSQEDENKNAKNVNVPSQNPPPVVDINENTIHQVTKTQTEEQTSPLTKVTPPKSTDPVSEKTSPQKTKSVSTHDDRSESNTVSPNVYPTLCTVTKKATSTYTQTSSPIHKPIFMHMSSTSTAYMSPPDVIMPRFSKRDYYASYDETYDSIKESHNSTSFKNYKSCKCKHQDQRRKKSSHQRDPATNSKKLNYQVEDVFTSNNISSADELSDACTKNYKTTTDSVYSRSCCACNNTKTCHKHKNEANGPKTCDHRKSMSIRDVPSKHAKYSKPNVTKRKAKTPLNPLIKEYVNKLLELNKEGMKAIEIINEECSSIPTPSSSIINDNLNLKGKSIAEKKISLEQIKNILKEKIINDLQIKEAEAAKRANEQTNKDSKLHTKLHKRKQLHKVKSLNISKKISTASECKNYLHDIQSSKSNTSSSSYKNDISEQPHSVKTKNCIKRDEKKFAQPHKTIRSVQDQQPAYDNKIISNGSVPLRYRSANIPPSSDSENTIKNNQDKFNIPSSNTSTQTNDFISEDNLVKVAEGKLQNMEKIADLTEKCTKRLSNLAKVLEEVRRNKSLFYSHLTSSDYTSDSEAERNRKKSSEISLAPAIIVSEIHKPSAPIEEKEINTGNNTFTPVLSDIPKPIHHMSSLSEPGSMTTLASSKESLNMENAPIRPTKSKPPPALSRIYLKNEQEHIIPHELSTVLEVESPMSLRVKSQSCNDMNADVISNASVKSVDNTNTEQARNSTLNISPTNSRAECLETNSFKTRSASRKIPKATDLNGDSSDNSKLPMMDMKQFNEIMLKPFISIKEFTKKNKLENGNGSNFNDHLKSIITNDDLSSLHSENSLPDVIAELLKRKVINEPFKFDTSNVNTSSTSESSRSLLALSNSNKDKKRTASMHRDKENIVETSDTLSISSNPDLENAFQRLGMGWASSTLKKTKERLALSSSSNTSSSSGPQTRSEIVNNPQSNADYILALQQHINGTRRSSYDSDPSKNVEQQTYLSNSMTVKEFLTNQLAKKITFINPSSKDFTEQEFISLYETRMPEEMKKMVEHDQSGNRARTSTPVQIFRSMTYNSTSSSNTSNGLFSNADLSSVKVTSNSIRNHSTSDKDDLTIPNYILKVTKGQSDCSKSD